MADPEKCRPSGDMPFDGKRHAVLGRVSSRS
jgi:hypothetical protein